LLFITSDYIPGKSGYNRDQVLVLHNAFILINNFYTFRIIIEYSGVTNATITGDLPTGTSFDVKAGFVMQPWMQQSSCVN
jgi:hypothetical protein